MKEAIEEREGFIRAVQIIEAEGFTATAQLRRYAKINQASFEE